MNTEMRKKPIGSGSIGIFAIAGRLSLASGLLGWGYAIYVTIGGLADPQFTAGDLATNLLVGVAVPAIFVVGGASLIGISRVRAAEREEYDKGSSIAQGIVIERFKEVESGRESDTTTYTVVIQFDTKAGPYTLRADVPKWLFRSTTPEKTIKVRYAESDPTIALLEGEW